MQTLLLPASASSFTCKLCGINLVFCSCSRSLHSTIVYTNLIEQIREKGHGAKTLEQLVLSLAAANPKEGINFNQYIHSEFFALIQHMLQLLIPVFELQGKVYGSTAQFCFYLSQRGSLLPPRWFPQVEDDLSCIKVRLPPWSDTLSRLISTWETKYGCEVVHDHGRGTLQVKFSGKYIFPFVITTEEELPTTLQDTLTFDGTKFKVDGKNTTIDLILFIARQSSLHPMH